MILVAMLLHVLSGKSSETRRIACGVLWLAFLNCVEDDSSVGARANFVNKLDRT